MVASKALKTAEVPHPVEFADLPVEELRWCTAMLNEVLARGGRMEASVFDVEGKHAREVLRECKWPIVAVAGSNGIAECYHRPRFKRIWVHNSNLPIFQPSQLTEINPKPNSYLSHLTNTDIDALRVHQGQILLTCSGTIGNCTYVSKTLDNCIFSHDVIRINCNESYPGYLYAFLNTKIGKALVRTNEYGAVVSHIEPEHLEQVPIPNPPPILQKRIHDLVIRSYALRDDSNEMLKVAEELLYGALKLLPLDKLKPQYYKSNLGLRNYTALLSRLDGRLDASYHVPLVDAILEKLKKEASEIITLSDPRISKDIILPWRFSRVYVQEGQGAVYFTGKHIFELDPSDKKYLSFARHDQRIKNKLTIRQNMVLVTCSGTLGKVILVPSHWDGWVMTHDIVRVFPISKEFAGFLWVFLSSDYGFELIKRFSYGAVVQHIEDHHIGQIAVPLLKDVEVQSEINRLALEANDKRSEAYHLEQEAISITNIEVIHASQKALTRPQ